MPWFTEFLGKSLVYIINMLIWKKVSWQLDLGTTGGGCACVSTGGSTSVDTICAGCTAPVGFLKVAAT
jgi:hypothetical protein